MKENHKKIILAIPRAVILAGYFLVCLADLLVACIKYSLAWLDAKYIRAGVCRVWQPKGPGLPQDAAKQEPKAKEQEPETLVDLRLNGLFTQLNHAEVCKIRDMLESSDIGLEVVKAHPNRRLYAHLRSSRVENLQRIWNVVKTFPLESKRRLLRELERKIVKPINLYD